MKTLLTTACIALCAMVASAKGFAVIDMETILEAHPNTPNDKKLLETTLEDYSEERDVLRAQLEEKQDRLSAPAECQGFVGDLQPPCRELLQLYQD